MERGRRYVILACRHPGRTPDVCDPLPARQTGVTAFQCGQGMFLLSHLFERVVRRTLEREANGQRSLQSAFNTCLIEELSRFLVARNAAPDSRWMSKVFDPRTQ